MDAPSASYEEVAETVGMPSGSIGPTRQRCLERLVDRTGPARTEWPPSRWKPRTVQPARGRAPPRRSPDPVGLGPRLIDRFDAEGVAQVVRALEAIQNDDRPAGPLYENDGVACFDYLYTVITKHVLRCVDAQGAEQPPPTIPASRT